MSERVEPIDQARGLYSVRKTIQSFECTYERRSEWNVTHRFSVTEFLKGGGDEHQEHDWCRGLDRDNANAPVVILRTGWNGWNAMRVLRQVTILRRLDHPNIVKIVDILKTQRNIVYVVFQDAGMSLDVWLDQKPPPHMSSVTVRAIMQQLVGVVGYLHRCSLVHSDIKPASILIHPVTLKVTIANFGQSRVFTGREQLAADCTFIDTSYFMEPVDGIDDDEEELSCQILERWKPANDMPQFSNNYLLCALQPIFSFPPHPLVVSHAVLKGVRPVTALPRCAFVGAATARPWTCLA
jgi:serine/threonine protein kinase